MTKSLINLELWQMNKITVSRKSVAILRVMVSGIFLVAGVNHLAMPQGVAKRLTASSMYEFFPSFINPEYLVVSVGVGLLIGGIFLLMNKFTRYAAMLLLGLLIPITISVQLQGLETLGPLFKNVAIAGALLFFINNQFENNKSETI
jgi:putative oxidoreductase